MEFFDSTGDPPSKEILILFDRLRQKCKDDLDKNIKININIKEHQRGNNKRSLCFNYIIRRVLGDSFEDITNNIIRDRAMNNNRNVYFRRMQGGSSENIDTTRHGRREFQVKYLENDIRRNLRRNLRRNIRRNDIQRNLRRNFKALEIVEDLV